MPDRTITIDTTRIPVSGSSLTPFTCEWAKQGLNNALDGLRAATSGVKSYKIGTRQTEYTTPSNAQASVDYWQKMVELLCPNMAALPGVITGRDSARRVILRDV